MKKRHKFGLIVLIIIILIAIFGLVSAMIDYERTQENKSPILAIKTSESKDDNGTKIYYGIGYKVIKCNTIVGDSSRHFGFYNMKREDKCINAIEHFPLNIEDNEQYTYEYKPTIKGGQHIFKVLGNVVINEDVEIKEYEDLADLEHNFGVKFLKNPNLIIHDLKLLSGFHIDHLGRITVNVSNVVPLDKQDPIECNGSTCTYEAAETQINITMHFLTQHAGEEEKESFKFYFNDFYVSEPPMKIYHIASLGVDLFVNGFPSGEGTTNMFEAMFIYDNIVYIIDGRGLNNNDLVAFVEAMKH